MSSHLIQNHFTATGIVFNGKNEILMINHKKQRVWLPPGGHIEENELPDEAVLREIFEETGVRAALMPFGHDLSVAQENCRELARPFTILLEDIEKDGCHNHIDLVYLCRALNEDLTPQDAETDGVGWFSCEEIKELNTYENVVKTAAKAQRLWLLARNTT
ncbi:MAG: NUDIX domain-containing protein [Peptococcaceae bacterium]|jgi:ADP-ribose pyrophosphatase YjhB (NUDIX family)|nr:NUDIX domain-containing protein [Peptococcaceae bacterium]